MTFNKMVKPVDMARRREAAIMQKVEALPSMKKATEIIGRLSDIRHRLRVLEAQAAPPSATRH